MTICRKVFFAVALCICLAVSASAQDQGVSGTIGNQGNDKLTGNAGGGTSTAPEPTVTTLPGGGISTAPEPTVLVLAGMAASGLVGFAFGRRSRKD